METTRQIENTSVFFVGSNGKSITAEAKITKTGGSVTVNGKTFNLTAVPFRYGAEYWSNNPSVKVLSLINGSVVWWLISIEQIFEKTKSETKTKGGKEQ